MVVSEAESFSKYGSLRVGTSHDPISGTRGRHDWVSSSSRQTKPNAIAHQSPPARTQDGQSSRGRCRTRGWSETTGMMTTSNALYDVDVYADSSEDSGNREFAGPRNPGGYRVGVSARNATEDDLDAASVSSSDSEDDAMLVALVSAIACGADRSSVLDPHHPTHVDTSSAWERAGEGADDADARQVEDATRSDLSSESSFDATFVAREVAHLRTKPRVRPARGRTRTESDAGSRAATRPSQGGSRRGPPPRAQGPRASVASHASSRRGNRATSDGPGPAGAFAGLSPAARVAAARAMAGALAREAVKTERAGSRRKPRVPRGRAPPSDEKRDASSSDASEVDAWWTKPLGAVTAKAASVAKAASETSAGFRGRRVRSASGARSVRTRAFETRRSSETRGRRLDSPSVAIDRTRPRPSETRGVTRWAEPKPPVPRSGPVRPKRRATGGSVGSASSGDSAALGDGGGAAEALRRRASATTVRPRKARGAPGRERMDGPMR